MASETIYVFLPNEAVDVWAPVDAQHVWDDLYRITNCRGEDNGVQFGAGVLVRCRRQHLSGEEVLIAYEKQVTI